MSRFTYYKPVLDTPWTTDGDPGFRGIDMLHDRGSLQTGFLARCENKRLRDGPAKTRLGTSFPGDFNPPFTDKIIGSFIYSNPNGDEVMLVATESTAYVWALEFGKDPVKVPIVSGDDTGLLLSHFVQAFDHVLLMRLGTVIAPGVPAILDWDGNMTQTVRGTTDSKFNEIVLSPTGLSLIPRTAIGVPFANRLLLYGPYNPTPAFRDNVTMTDILDYTSYDPLLNVFRINAGESDMITSVFPYFQGRIVVFMNNSTHMLENFTIDPFQAAQRLLNSRIGAVGYQGPVMVGQDVIFLSKAGGFYRLSQIVQEEITTSPVPISRAIQPIIDRINWERAIFFSTSVALGDYAYFALPVDQGAGAANVVVVYNTVTNEWESAPDSWDDPNFRINRMHVTLYDGSPRVFGLDYDASRVYLFYDGLADHINGASLPVHDVIETRGYTAGDPGTFKRFERLVLGLQTLGPTVEITAISDGYNEEKILTDSPLTKDPLKSYIHGHVPDPTDPDEPKREDYATGGLDFTFAIQDYEGLPVGVITSIPGSGGSVLSAKKQQSLERMAIRQNGRWCSIRVDNTQGQCDVLGVGVDAIPAQEATSVVA
jgi:hypothetical protein